MTARHYLPRLVSQAARRPTFIPASRVLAVRSYSSATPSNASPQASAAAGSSTTTTTTTTAASSTATSGSGSGAPTPPRPVDDSTSALEYKLHKRKLPPFPTLALPRAPTAEEAVNNILYNTPPPSLEPYKRHTLNCLVQNEPGVLSRVSGILAARGFNIDSLVVCATEIRDLSRMCIVLRGQDGVIEQARRQLEDLVPVWAVLDYTNTPTIARELLLAKVSILGPEYAQEQMMSGTDRTSDEKFDRERQLAESFESSGAARSTTAFNLAGDGHNALSRSEALIAKNLHLNSIKILAEQFGARIVDVAENSVIVELAAKSSRVDSFLSLLRPFGVLEAARSGSMVMPRTPVASPYEDDDVVGEAAAVDASLLPPG